MALESVVGMLKFLPVTIISQVLDQNRVILFLLSLNFGVYHLVSGQPLPKHVDQTRAPEEENLNVLHQWLRWNDPGSLLIGHLNRKAFDMYDLRDREIAGLQSRADWIRRQDLVRKKLAEIVGPFPEKSALNPTITGTIERQGFRIEKMIYESWPGHYVTACLYLPDPLPSRVPGVLNLIGHEQESFRAELDQLVNINLAKNGMVVMTIDPPGQGEHVQYFDPEVDFSSVGYSVVEHCYFGNQCFLSGISSARYFIWDAIRAIDYLVSRMEVDPGRIGVTGFSGGGTITNYVAALDERVLVSIPSSWSTASRRQLETKGAQDAEAELVGSLAAGITLEDLIEVRAPKPTLMTFVSRDQYLALQGAREAFREAGKAYQAFGQPENLQLVEDDSRHWLTPRIRMAIYAFFMKHFNLEANPVEEEIEVMTAEKLQVTPTGQISTSLGGRMIFDLQMEEAQKLVEKLEASRRNLPDHLHRVIRQAREISGYVSPGPPVEDVFINGRYQRDGYSVGKYAMKGEGDYVIPFLLYVPDDGLSKHPALVYLHPEGKIAEARPGGEIERLVKQGYIVAATDVLGTGETRNTASRELAPAYTGVLTGHSVVGIQAGDIVRIAGYLRSREDVDPGRVGALAYDGLCIPLMHATAFDTVIRQVILVRPLISYRSVAMNRFYRVGLTRNEGGGTRHPFEVDFSWGVAGALKAYDLPDLIGCLAPRRVILVESTDQMLKPASEALIRRETELPHQAFIRQNAGENLRIIPKADDMVSLLEWSFQQNR
jgi:cephalosporin-C deacetylase-like acetyl esterase